MLFNWIRRYVCSAVLAGVSDAVEKLQAGAPADAAGIADELAERLHPALPAPIAPADEPAPAAGRSKRKAD